MAATFRELGVDVAGLVTSLRSELRESGLDREALASLGIDLDAVRERAEAVFGPGALDSAGHGPGRIPFSRDAAARGSRQPGVARRQERLRGVVPRVRRTPIRHIM